MVKVIGVGDCMVDKNLTTGMMYPGGQALNIAVNTKLCGAQSAFIGAFGDDYIADHMKKTMDEIGIDYSHSHFYHAPNAFARYKVIDNDRVFQRSPNGRYNPLQGAIRRMLAYEGFSQEDIAYIKGFDVMHTSLWTLNTPATVRLLKNISRSWRAKALKSLMTFPWIT